MEPPLDQKPLSQDEWLDGNLERSSPIPENGERHPASTPSGVENQAVTENEDRHPASTPSGAENQAETVPGAGPAVPSRVQSQR